MKKIEGQMADVIKEIISEGDSVVEIEGKEYYLTLTEKPEKTVAEDVEADPKLKQKLLQAKMDIFNGKTYTTDEVGEMIDQGKLQMNLEQTEQALEAFRNLRSQHYTQFETVEHKKRLLDNIQEKVILLSTSIPVKKGE